IGSLVVVPAGASDDPVAFRITTGFDGSDASCTPPDPRCIEASRALHYLPHEALRLPVALRLSCAGVVCSAGDTCVEGSCVGNAIDPGQCVDAAGCDEHSLGGGGSGGAPPVLGVPRFAYVA